MVDFKKVDELKQKLDSKRPLPEAAVRNLREVFRVDWTYNSNAIEGNTLTLLETKLVLEEGLTIGGKSLREHFEVLNHGEAITYIEELVSTQTPLSEKVIKDVHHLILKNIDDENAGMYRKINVAISGSQHQPPHFLKVPDEMGGLMRWYQSEVKKLHPVELAALLHFKFVYIHPFVDGNGRTARLLMNMILMSYGYPPAILKADTEKRIAYYDSLEKASVQGEVEPFIQMVVDSTEESLLRYINAIE
ncbi:Fic family protein [Effusibacillus consociatus]|uniref:Fic family protein n=1 Tax=Effusibacillus consociatus TaxID=1117041 RepID=A0ABV9PY20_9BACL